MENKEEEKKKRKGIIIILVILLFLISACGVVYLMWNFYNNYMADNIYTQVQSYVEETEEEVLIDNPVDFEKFKGINTDIYAWITVPNTRIDYPVVQTDEDDYYLKKSIYKKYLFAGAIYTNDVNGKDFSDPVTVLYGHNMKNGSMFADLHKFESKDFFNENDVFYIYQPGRRLTYKIVSAIKYDNRRITAAFDFTKQEDFNSFSYAIMNPKYDLKNVRDFTIKSDDKIVTLSTCVPNRASYRYIVSGVLINDERTK